MAADPGPSQQQASTRTRAPKSENATILRLFVGLAVVAVLAFVAGMNHGESKGYQAADVTAQERYDSGFEAGKAAAAKDFGQFILVSPDARFKANDEDSWYVISLMENPDPTQAEYAPYVVDAWVSVDKKGDYTAKQIDHGSLRVLGNHMYTQRKKGP